MNNEYTYCTPGNRERLTPGNREYTYTRQHRIDLHQGTGDRLTPQLRKRIDLRLYQGTDYILTLTTGDRLKVGIEAFPSLFL